MEEGEENKESVRAEKEERINELEHKFQEIIDMLIENYSTNM